MCLAIPGKITHIEDPDPVARTGIVDFGGVSKKVNLTFVPEANVHDYVLVHVGFAISQVSEENARQTLAYLTPEVNHETP